MVAVRRRTGLLGTNLDADASNNLYIRAAESDNYVWDTGTLAWVKMTQPGGGGSAVTVADGADVAEGSRADAAWVSGSGTVIALLKTIASGGGGGSGPVTIIDGGDVAEGATTDAAVITDTTGTLSGKIRGLVKWAFERMPASLAQKTMANSLPVVIASDQASIPVAATLAAETTKVIGTVNQGTSPWVVGQGTATSLKAEVVGPTADNAANPTAKLAVLAGVANAAAPTRTETNVVPLRMNLAGDVAVTLDGEAISGSVTANAGTNLNTSLLALDSTVAKAAPQTDRTQKSQITDGTRDGTVKAASTLPLLTDTAVVTTQRDPLPAGTNVIGHAIIDTGSTTAATQATAANLKSEVVGNKTNNNAAPGATNVGALPAVATAADQAWTEGNLVAASVDLAGFLRMKMSSWLGSTAPTVAQKAMASSIPVVIASDQTVIPVNGDVDHDAVNTLKNIQAAGNASPTDVPPTLVSANGDRTRIWVDRAGAVIVRRRKLRESFTVVYRLAETAAREDLTFTFVANTNKQLATLHHAATATKEMRLMKCQIQVLLLGTVAGVTHFELRRINTAPATGNPAITPAPHQNAAAATEAIALALPTTAGTEIAANSPLGSFQIDYGIMAAAGAVANPALVSAPITLYDANQEDDEELPPILRVGTLEGWAVNGRSTAAVVLRYIVTMRYTEEIP